MNFKARRIFAIASIFPTISLLIFFLFTSPLFADSQKTTIKIGIRTHSGADAALKMRELEELPVRAATDTQACPRPNSSPAIRWAGENT